MLDLKFIRENSKLVKEALKKLNTQAPVDEILSLDERRRMLIKDSDELKNLRNVRSKEIGAMKDKDERQIKIDEMQAVNENIRSLDETLKKVEKEMNEFLLLVPNMPCDYVPVGKDESENIVVKTHGEPKKFAFDPKPHWEIAENLDLIDFGRGVKISGTRFYFLKGPGARLQRALISWMLDLHTSRHGYTELYPPAMVKRDCMVGTGNLPKFSENLYFDTEDDMWFVPTAEVPVTNFHREEILSVEILPLCYVAYSPCFRREKASAGKDTRGIKRVHQFDKVELVKFTEPEKSNEELQKLLKDAEEIPKLLKIPYRVVQMCTGDLSFVACAKYDIEMWAAGCNEWLEVSSCSSFSDFQARRSNIRFRRTPQSKPEFVHTLNGSGLALPRTFASILEYYQQKDGSVVIPEVLKPYMSTIEIMSPKK